MLKLQSISITGSLSLMITPRFEVTLRELPQPRQIVFLLRACMARMLKAPGKVKTRVMQRSTRSSPCIQNNGRFHTILNVASHTTRRQN